MTAATATNVRWGPNLVDVFDYALHPTRDGGRGNPLLIWRHTGGGTSGSHANLWNGPHYELNQLLTYLMDPARPVHFDVVSVESAQYTFFEAGNPIPRNQRVCYPQIIHSHQRSIRAVKGIMQALGSDPSRVGLMGASHGAWSTLMTQLLPPEFGGSMPRADVRRRFDYRGYDHRCKLMWIWSLAYPDWRKIASPTGITFSAVPVAGTAVNGAGTPFNHFRYSGSTDLFVITSGTGSIVPGSYPITAKNSNNNNLTLATSAGTGNATGYLTTDQTDIRWAGMLFGLRSPGNGADGLPIYTEWDLIPDAMKNGVSPQHWAETGQLGMFPPTLFSSVNTAAGGNGIHPYGNTYDGASNIHDWHGASDLSAALRARGVDSDFYPYDENVVSWTNFTDPARVYDWMAQRINA